MSDGSMLDALIKPSLVYKYRGYSARALEMLIQRELYFASPKSLNDPYDCQLDIHGALGRAIQKVNNNDYLVKKITGISNVKYLLDKIQNDASNAGVLSFSTEANNSLMWSHYADSHSGFCVGFNLNDQFNQVDPADNIIGSTFVSYDDADPYEEYFAGVLSSDDETSFNEFWVTLLGLGMTSKSKAWQYEKEVRVIRKQLGPVPFDPAMLVQVIFGMNMSEHQRDTIKKVLSRSEWNHVKYYQILRADGFSLKVEELV